MIVSSPIVEIHPMYRLRLIAGIAALAAIPTVSVAQAPHQIVYSYAAVLDSAGGHYVPMWDTSYPPNPHSGWQFFSDVIFRFTNKQTGAPANVVANANNPGVSFAGYHVVDGQNVPSAWLIKVELIPSTGAPRRLTPSTLGDKFYVAYDTAAYVFNSISLADPDPTMGGPSMIKRTTNFADLPDIPGGSMRSDFARAAVAAAPAATVAPTGVKLMPKNPTPVLKPTIPVIKH